MNSSPRGEETALCVSGFEQRVLVRYVVPRNRVRRKCFLFKRLNQEIHKCSDARCKIAPARISHAQPIGWHGFVSRYTHEASLNQVQLDNVPRQQRDTHAFQRHATQNLCIIHLRVRCTGCVFIDPAVGPPVPAPCETSWRYSTFRRSSLTAAFCTPCGAR